MASSESVDGENTFKTAWEALFESCLGSEGGRVGLAKLWEDLEKEMVADRWGFCHKNCLCDLIRLTLRRGIEPEWEIDATETKRILKSIESLIPQVGVISEAKSLEHLRMTIENPWKNDKILKLMAGNSSLTSEILVNYMAAEGLDACRRRLEILKETGFHKVVLNVAAYYVRALVVQKFMSENINLYHSDIVEILFIWVTMTFEFKDTSYLYNTLQSIPFTVVFDVLNRLQIQLRDAKNDGKSTKIFDRAYHDVLICAMDDLFANKRSSNPTFMYGEDLVNLWMDLFINNIPGMKKEIHIYMKDSSNSDLFYIMGTDLFNKLGSPIIETSLALIITGIIADLNLKQSESGSGDNSRRLSEAYVQLSKFIPDNLTYQRECILTAFSVRPTQELMDEIVALAKKSGFVESVEKSNQDNRTTSTENTLNLSSIQLRDMLDKFEEISDSFIDSLKKGYYNKSSSHAFRWATDKKKRNLDGLLLIQGELLTCSMNYDPLATPVKSLSPEVLCLSQDLTADLINVINAPRWHVLSWVMEWSKLEEYCINLLKNPAIKNPSEDLNYLVVDYTQFDDWSSEEDVQFSSGVEKGYEHWENIEFYDPDQIDEKGLSDNELATLDLNVIPDIRNKDKNLEIEEKCYVKPEEEKSSAEANPTLHAPSSEDIETLINTVPGLLRPDPDLIAPAEPVEMNIGIVQLTTTGPMLNMTSVPSLSLQSNSSSANDEIRTEIVIQSAGTTEEAQSSVDSLANSLISQIQTPVISLPESKATFAPKTNIIKIITPSTFNNSTGEIVVKKVSDSPSDKGQYDLIRQLNLARSQGLVVLKQWGDKQVLVHKATGRWIMRQGNRLVTVPPQALGIQSTSASAASPPPSSISSSSGSRDQDDDDLEVEEDETKNNTMKQLAEFDSILESKFTNPSVHNEVLSGASNSSTYVLLHSSSATTNTASLSSSCTSTVKKGANNTPGHTTSCPSKVSQHSILIPNKSGQSKPQEDPVTLKRIQQILDDYNEQIRKSPDLQNRPAPRRRCQQQLSETLVSSPPSTPPSVTTTSLSVQNPPSKKRKVTESSCNKLLSEVLEPGQVTTSVQSTPGTSRAIVRQVVVPPAVAASLQSSKNQLVFLSGNKKIVALKPLVIQQQGNAKTRGSLGRLKTVLVHQSIVSNNNNNDEEKRLRKKLIESEEDEPHSSGRGIHEMLTPPPSSSALSPAILTPPTTMLDRPSSPPGLGIPMEMTPGQIMEAEISANISDNPYSPLSQCSSASNRSESF